MSTPITKVIYPMHIVAHKLVEISNEIADDGRPQMTGMERLCDVRGAVLNKCRFNTSVALLQQTRAK